MAYEELNDRRKILSFKSLAIVHPSVITTVPLAIINQLNNVQKTLYWTKKSKIKTFNTFK